ncbi:hypothetical protein Ddye_026686 [Dipteronia dyeriana]|uniref:Uncharacterized protein n=1 Tax=Dipteronia dyeriana TaxID=168575 RepID=A0AAD9TMU1_9ROSI|nr:hypothetical protein Ddye_026686 [Dipteronia dyeriana]
MVVANRIERIQRSFLWGDNAVKQKFHAVRSMDVRKRKGNGGLGIGRILDKNMALLAKRIWRFDKDDNTSWRRVVCLNYGVDETSLFWSVQDFKMPPFL